MLGLSPFQTESLLLGVEDLSLHLFLAGSLPVPNSLDSCWGLILLVDLYHQNLTKIPPLRFYPYASQAASDIVWKMLQGFFP